jgi:hypothetical protein
MISYDDDAMATVEASLLDDRQEEKKKRKTFSNTSRRNEGNKGMNVSDGKRQVSQITTDRKPNTALVLHNDLAGRTYGRGHASRLPTYNRTAAALPRRRPAAPSAESLMTTRRACSLTPLTHPPSWRPSWSWGERDRAMPSLSLAPSQPASPHTQKRCEHGHQSSVLVSRAHQPPRAEALEPDSWKLHSKLQKRRPTLENMNDNRNRLSPPKRNTSRDDNDLERPRPGQSSPAAVVRCRLGVSMRRAERAWWPINRSVEGQSALWCGREFARYALFFLSSFHARHSFFFRGHFLESGHQANPPRTHNALSAANKTTAKRPLPPVRATPHPARRSLP